MKKLISLIASLSLAATMVAPVFAAAVANNAPVVETTVTPLTADEYYNDWMEEDLPEGQAAYLVEVSAKGFDLSSVRAGSSATKKNNRTGVILMYASYGMEFDNVENVAAVYAFGGFAKNTTEEKKAYCIKNYDDPALAYPVASSDETLEVTADKISNVQQYIITTTADVVGTPYAEFKVTQFDNSSSAGQPSQNFSDALANIKYTVNGVEATTVSLPGPAVGGDDEGDDEGDAQDIIISDRLTLENLGYAWDVTINNYDSNKTYTATFKAPGESDKVHDLSFTVEADNGTIAFAALLKTTKANVELAIAKN